MKVTINRLLTECEFCGGAVAPPHVLALVTTVRKYVALTVAMAAVIETGKCTRVQMNSLCDMMADARTVELPNG